jgi:glycosyltransferase 2 family protein
MDESRGQWRRRLWKTAKGALTLGILAAVAWAFVPALRDLEKSEYSWQPGWLVVAGGIYLGAAFFSVVFWVWALRRMGQEPGLRAATRAYFVGTLGKYVPGKALAIVLRTGLIRGPKVRTGVAAYTVVYETLIYMATAAVWAVVVLGARYAEEEERLQSVILKLSEQGGLAESLRLWHVLVLVLAVACLPTVPALYTRLIRGVVRPFQQADASPLPALPAVVFPGGLLIESAGWVLSGLSLWAAVQSVHAVPLSIDAWLEFTAYLGLSTVISFFTPVPGGLGIRELALFALLIPELGQGPAALVAILFRLTWIVTEVVAAGVLYWMPVSSQ